MVIILKFRFLFVVLIFSLLVACEPSTQLMSEDGIDNDLRLIINENNLSGDALALVETPDISDPQPQLGMHLFFSKSLSGEHDSACVSCHHPMLGGGDNLSLSIGVRAAIPDMLGPGRVHDAFGENHDGGPTVPRNAPTTFNIAAWDEVLFHDGRVESLGKTPNANGSDGLGIRTPDTALGVLDSRATDNLASAQARFPLTSNEEMKGFNYVEMDNQEIRDMLASRLGNYGSEEALVDPDYWLAQFQVALNQTNGSAEQLITEQNIAMLIGEYERSQSFTNSPWKSYVEGKSNSISYSAKKGALLFFTSVSAQGAGCSSCHSGDLFSDESFHNIAMPQIGRGKGDGDEHILDFGRYKESGMEKDRYAFRTPSLLNVEVTGPWSHAGAYTSLEAVVKHHFNPLLAIADYDIGQLSQTGIQNLDKLQYNSQPVLDKLEENRRAGLNTIPIIKLNDNELDQLVSFLKALTDPCVKDRDCLSNWIPDSQEDTNGHQLDAMDRFGKYL